MSDATLINESNETSEQPAYPRMLINLFNELQELMFFLSQHTISFQSHFDETGMQLYLTRETIKFVYAPAVVY